MISIRHARLEERRTVFEWLCRSNTTPLHMGPPDYPGNPVPDWEAFQSDFEPFYFQEEGRPRGSVMMIEENGAGIGCLCYACFHLVPPSAELDIWFADLKFCGKGYGPQALVLLRDYLTAELGISRFLIRPSARNTRAIAAYRKAGFAPVADKAAAIARFVLPEYRAIYGDGDYGLAQTAVLTAE